MLGAGEVGKVLAIKEHEGIFVCHRSALYYICGCGDMTTYDCQNSSNHTLKINVVIGILSQ